MSASPHRPPSAQQQQPQNGRWFIAESLFPYCRIEWLAQNSPSIAYLSWQDECEARAAAVDACIALARACRLPIEVISAASTFIQRYYLRHAIDPITLIPTVAAALLLAAKSEDTPIRLHELLSNVQHYLTTLDTTQSYTTLTTLNFTIPTTPCDLQLLREDLTTIELQLFITLEFNVEVEHVHQHALMMLKQVLRLTSSSSRDVTDVVQCIWELCTMSMRSTLCLHYNVRALAVGMILLAAVYTDYPVQSSCEKSGWCKVGEGWYTVCGCTEHDLRHIASLLMETSKSHPIVKKLQSLQPWKSAFIAKPVTRESSRRDSVPPQHSHSDRAATPPRTLADRERDRRDDRSSHHRSHHDRDRHSNSYDDERRARHEQQHHTPRRVDAVYIAPHSHAHRSDSDRRHHDSQRQQLHSNHERQHQPYAAAVAHGAERNNNQHPTQVRPPIDLTKSAIQSAGITPSRSPPARADAALSKPVRRSDDALKSVSDGQPKLPEPQKPNGHTNGHHPPANTKFSIRIGPDVQSKEHSNGISIPTAPAKPTPAVTQTINVTIPSTITAGQPAAAKAAQPYVRQRRGAYQPPLPTPLMDHPPSGTGQASVTINVPTLHPSEQLSARRTIVLHPNR